MFALEGVPRLGQERDDGGARMAADDGDVFVRRVGGFEGGDEAGGADDVEGGDTEEAGGVVDGVGFEDFGGDGDGGVYLSRWMSLTGFLLKEEEGAGRG